VPPVQILEIDTEERDGYTSVALRGELDLSTVGQVQEALDRVEQSEPAVLVVDLSKLAFLDSTGLRCLVTADERAREQGRRFVILRGPDAVHRFFSIRGLEQRLEILDDISALS
jgi:anti-anti-sigma factor